MALESPLVGRLALAIHRLAGSPKAGCRTSGSPRAAPLDLLYIAPEPQDNGSASWTLRRHGARSSASVSSMHSHQTRAAPTAR